MQYIEVQHQKQTQHRVEFDRKMKKSNTNKRADIEIICIKYDTILIAKFIVGERRREINTR